MSARRSVIEDSDGGEQNTQPTANDVAAVVEARARNTQQRTGAGSGTGGWA